MKLGQLQFAIGLILFVTSGHAAIQQGLRAVIFYTYDDSFTGSDIFVQELNAATYEKVFTSKEFVTKPKALSNAYEFLNFLDGRCDFQVKCEKQIIPKPKELSCPAKEVCPLCPKPKDCPSCPKAKDCGPTSTTNVPTPTTKVTTYAPATTSLPVIPQETTTTPRPALKKLCKNSAPDSAYPDCCENGGSGKYCCANGANNPDCCANNGKGKYCCTNGATNEFCCTNGATNKECKVPVVTTTTPESRTYLPPETTTFKPSVKKLCKNNAPDSSYPDCCENGGSGKYCCENGANNPDCCANPKGKGPYCCENGATNEFCCKNGAFNKECKIEKNPKCKNNAPDSSYPDCCVNGGKGKYCCANGANNPDCCANNGKGPYCCTNGATNEFCCTNGATNKECKIAKVTVTEEYITPPTTKPAPVTTKPTVKPTTPRPITTTKFKGPAYLPQSTVTTTPGEKWTGTYRTFEGTFRQGNTWEPFTAAGTWRTRKYTAGTFTTTPKYERKYNENGLLINA